MTAREIERKCLPVVLLDFTLADWKRDGTCRDRWESVDELGAELLRTGRMPKRRRLYPGRHFLFVKAPAFYADKGTGAIAPEGVWRGADGRPGVKPKGGLEEVVSVDGTLWVPLPVMEKCMEQEDGELFREVQAVPSLEGMPFQNVLNAFCRAWRLERGKEFSFKTASVQEHPFRDFC